MCLQMLSQETEAMLGVFNRNVFNIGNQGLLNPCLLGERRQGGTAEFQKMWKCTKLKEATTELSACRRKMPQSPWREPHLLSAIGHACATQLLREGSIFLSSVSEIAPIGPLFG